MKLFYGLQKAIIKYLIWTLFEYHKSIPANGRIRVLIRVILVEIHLVKIHLMFGIYQMLKRIILKKQVTHANSLLLYHKDS